MNTNIITAAMLAVLSIPASAVVNIDWVTVGNVNKPKKENERVDPTPLNEA